MSRRSTLRRLSARTTASRMYGRSTDDSTASSGTIFYPSLPGAQNARGLSG